MRSLLTVLVLVFIASLGLSAQERRFAVVTYNKVSVMAGPKTPDAELMKASSGQVVEYLGESGEFGKVRWPGGVVAYVAEGRAAKPYLKIEAPGEARVLVSRLHLRPQPNLDWPPMGTLAPNDRLLVLEGAKDGWLKVMAPRDQAVYIHRDYLDLKGDQAVLATTFANSDDLGRTQLLASGNVSKEAVDRITANQNLNEDLKTAEQNMATYSSGSAHPQSLAELEAQYAEIAAAAPEGSLARTTAEERLEYIRGRRDAAEKFDAAKERIAEIERDRRRRDAKYQEGLASYRENKEREMATPKAKTSRFMTYGIGELHPVYLSSNQRPTWVLSKGLEKRFAVTSLRYDLSEYQGKTIGITGWEKIGTPVGSQLQQIEITRMEVVN